MNTKLSFFEVFIVIFFVLLGFVSLSFLGYKGYENSSYSDKTYYASITSDTGLEVYKDIITHTKTNTYGWTALCSLPIEKRTIGGGYWQAIMYKYDNIEPLRLFCFSIPCENIDSKNELEPLSIPFKNSGNEFLKEELHSIKHGQMFISGYGRIHYVIEAQGNKFKIDPSIDDYETSRPFLWVREESGYFSSAVIDQSKIIDVPSTESKKAFWSVFSKIFNSDKK